MEIILKIIGWIGFGKSVDATKIRNERIENEKKKKNLELLCNGGLEKKKR